MVSRMVRWRSGRSRAPPVSTCKAAPVPTRSRPSPRSRASNTLGGSSLTHAAASSIASGSPSRRAQIAAIAPALASVRAKVGLTAWARCTKRSTAGYCSRASGAIAPGSAGNASGGTGCSRSPRTRSAARLVATISRRGQVASSSATSGAADMTCSKLSSRSSVLLSRRCANTSSRGERPPPSRSPSVSAIARTTCSGSRAAAN